MEKRTFFWKGLTRLMLVVLLTGVVLFGLALGALSLAEVNPPPVSHESGAVIVLGCQVYANSEPSPQLELRLEAALKTYRELPRLVIACGGQGENEPGPEGEIMREWLIRHGVPEEDVMAETQSMNTRQNLKNAKALLPEDVDHVTVITSDYHLPRALALCQDLGLDADGIGSPCRPELQHWIKNHAREVLGWGKYLLEKMMGEE